MRIRNLWNISALKDLDKYPQITLFLKDVYEILRSGFKFSDNFRGNIIVCQFTATNTNTSFIHGLSTIPNSYIVLSSSANMVIYDGTSQNTDKLINLRASAQGTARLLVFTEVINGL